MSDKPKKKMSENSLKNLKKGKPFDANCEEIARKAQKKSVEKRKENDEKKVKRENAVEWLWETYGIQLSEEIFKNGTTKDKTELLKAILPKDKQIENKINIVPQIVVEDEEHKKMLEDL